MNIDAGQHPFLEANASLTLIVCYYDCVALDLMEIGAICINIGIFISDKPVNLQSSQMKRFYDLSAIRFQLLHYKFAVYGW